jgi:hypothetical protein
LAHLQKAHILVMQVALNGISVTPGTEVLIKLQPELYTITDIAKVCTIFILVELFFCLNLCAISD